MLNIINCNVRSYQRNCDQFLPLFDKSKPHVICLNETWFTSEYQADIPYYSSFHTIRPDRLSGGVSIFVHESITSRKLTIFSFSNDDIEICSVELIINGETLIVVAVYRPHSGTVEKFTDELENIIQNQSLRKHRWCIGGDFNIDILRENNQNSRFFNMFNSYHFFPVINRPTRFSQVENHRDSLLDHIWTNSLTMLNSGIIDFDATDHCPTFIQIPVHTISSIDNNEKVKIIFRVNNEINRQLFHDTLAGVDWQFLSFYSVDESMTLFIEKINSIYRSIFPTKMKLIPRQKALNPWINPRLEKLINMKSTYFQLLKIGSISKEENNFFKNRVKN